MQEIIKQAKKEAEERYANGSIKEWEQVAFVAGVSWTLAHLAPRLETVWKEVPVSEGLPTIEGWYFTKCAYLESEDCRMVSLFQKGKWSIATKYVSVTAWLDPTQIVAQESDAVGFAEWIRKEQYSDSYEMDGTPYWFKDTFGLKDGRHDTKYTTAQLYTIYKSTLLAPPANKTTK